MEKDLTTEKTTQELLQNLQNSLKYHRAKSRGVTKEELKAQYEEFARISETLRLHELRLLYYLRNSKFSTTYGFMRMAEKLYEASQELDEISLKINRWRVKSEE